MSQCLSLEQSKQVVLTDEPGNRLTERIDGANRRRRVDDGGVGAEDELVDAEGLDAQLERPPAVRRGVEVHVAVERRADVGAARGETLELDRPTAGQDREHDRDVRPTL